MKVTRRIVTRSYSVLEQSWFCEEAPGYEVLRELVKDPGVHETVVTFKLIDFGDDPAKKTAVGVVKEDVEKTEQRKVMEILARAEQDLIDGSAIFRKIADAVREPPADAERLADLLGMVERSRALFARAREAYLSVKDRAPHQAKVEDRLAKTERIISSLARTEEELRARRK